MAFVRVLTKSSVTFVFFMCFVVLARSAVTPDTSDATAKDSKKLNYDKLPHCDYKSDDFSVCVGKLIDAMFLHTTDVGLESIDPFVLNRTTYQYRHQAASGRLTVKNALVYGFSKGYHTKIDVDVSKKGKAKLYGLLNLPKLEIIGNYKATIQLNNAQLKPKGSFNLTLSDIIIESWLNGTIVEQSGQHIIVLEDFLSEPRANDFKINATGIFDDPELNTVALELLNSTWRQLFATMLPETRKYWAPMIMEMLNKVLNVLPLEKFIDNLPELIVDE